MNIDGFTPPCAKAAHLASENRIGNDGSEGLT